MVERMTGDATVELQLLIDRLRQGDPQACRDLLERAHGRLRKLAGRIISGSFPALRGRHNLDSVVDDPPSLEAALCGCSGVHVNLPDVDHDLEARGLPWRRYSGKSISGQGPWPA
jgi:hypothetical protein